MILNCYMFFCIHLPGFMRLGRPGQVGPRRSPRRRGGQVGAHEPALERSLRGDGPSWRFQEELHPDHAGAPGGVLTAQVHGRLHQLAGRGRGGRGVPVIRWDAVAAAAAKPLEEAAHGGIRHIAGCGDRAGLPALLPEPEHRLTDRDRDGARHGQTSQESHHETDHPILYRCRGAIKPRVGISRSILMSRDS
jgi:hypothetical protein